MSLVICYQNLKEKIYITFDGGFTMKFCILMGSLRLNGNTAELLKPFIFELYENGCDVTYKTLSYKNIQPCKGCYSCQNVDGQYGCVQKDDVLPQQIEHIVTSEL